MGKTISMSVGRVAIAHDVRIEISANVDEKLMSNNEIFIDKLKDFDYDVVAYTDAKFQTSIDEYNAKQSREDRKKNKSYTELIADENKKLIEKSKQNKEKGIKNNVRKPTKLVHEYVLQVGDRETNGTLDADIEKNREFARKTVEKMQKKYPHADILLATFHADEPNGTPHLHILIQFVGENYKQGLSKQISMSKALELDGFERSQNRGNYAINQWCENVKDTIMTENLEEIFQEEREVVGEHRQHEDTVVFREKAKAEEQYMKTQREEFYKEKEKIEKEIDNLDFEYGRKLFENERQIEQQDFLLKNLEEKIDKKFSELSLKTSEFEKISSQIEKSKEIYLETEKAVKMANTSLERQKKKLEQLENHSQELEAGILACDMVKEIISEMEDMLDVLPDDYREEYFNRQLRRREEEKRKEIEKARRIKIETERERKKSLEEKIKLVELINGKSSKTASEH